MKQRDRAPKEAWGKPMLQIIAVIVWSGARRARLDSGIHSLVRVRAISL